MVGFVYWIGLRILQHRQLQHPRDPSSANSKRDDDLASETKLSRVPSTSAIYETIRKSKMAQDTSQPHSGSLITSDDSMEAFKQRMRTSSLQRFKTKDDFVSWCSILMTINCTTVCWNILLLWPLFRPQDISAVLKPHMMWSTVRCYHRHVLQRDPLWAYQQIVQHDHWWLTQVVFNSMDQKWELRIVMSRVRRVSVVY